MLRQSERRLCIQRCMCHLVKEMSTNSYLDIHLINGKSSHKRSAAP